PTQEACMRPSRLSLVTSLWLVTALLSQAHALLVPGKNGNCSALWDTGAAAATVGTGKSMLSCTDGDPSCDADGMPNGACVVHLNACVGELTAECTPDTLGSLRFTARTLKRLARFVAPPASSPGTCGVPGALHLSLVRVPKNTSKPLRTFKPSRKMTLSMKARGLVNKLSVQCLPCTRDACGPVTTTS